MREREEERERGDMLIRWVSGKTQDRTIIMQKIERKIIVYLSQYTLLKVSESEGHY